MSESLADTPHPALDPWGMPVDGPPSDWRRVDAPPPDLGDAGGDTPPARVRWMDFDPERRVPRWGVPDVLLGLLAWFVCTIAAIVPVVLVTDDKAVINLVGLTGSWIGMVGFLLLVCRWKGQGSLGRDFGLRFRWFDPLIGILTGLVTVVAVDVVIRGVAALFDAPPGDNKDSVFSDQSNVTIVIITALMASIGAPLVEELFFRGLVLRAIGKRAGTIVGVVVSSLVFGLLHWQGATLGSAVSLVTGIAVMGVVFALLTRWLRRLGPAIFTHMTINGLASIVLVSEVLSK